MTQKIKNYVGMSLIVGIIAIAYAAVTSVGAYKDSIEPTSFRSFSVSAEGKSITVPDIAKFSFSVITQGGKNVAELQKQNTDKINKVIKFLKDNKVSDKDIKTQSYSIEPRYQYFNCYEGNRVCPPAEIVGYTINQSVDVKVRDFGKIGDLLGGIVKSGANSVSQLQFTIDDPVKKENEARSEAIKKARVKAEEIAKAGNFRLGGILSITEGGYAGAPYMYRAEKATAIGMGGVDVASAPSIEPGSEEVIVNVTITYEIR